MKFGVLGILVVAWCVGCGSKDETAATPPADGPPPKVAPMSASGSPAAAGSYAAVQQVFTANCAGCHGAGRPKAGIDLTSYEGVMKGGRQGAIIKVGDADGSLLSQALHGAGGAKQMPPKGALPAADVKTVDDWIKAGAKNG